MQKELAETVNE